MFEHISQNITDLNVIGGEPTLIPEFYEMFEYCDKQNTLGDKSVTLVTNLTNKNPKMPKWVPKLKENPGSPGISACLQFSMNTSLSLPDNQSSL